MFNMLCMIMCEGLLKSKMLFEFRCMILCSGSLNEYLYLKLLFSFMEKFMMGGFVCDFMSFGFLLFLCYLNLVLFL